MEKLNRRKFLKAIGLAITCPLGFAKAEKLSAHPVDDVLLDLGFPNNKVMQAAREYCDEKVSEFPASSKGYCYQWDVHHMEILCCYVGDVVLLHSPGNRFIQEDIKVVIIGFEHMYRYEDKYCMVQIKAIPLPHKVYDPMQLFVLDDSSNFCVTYLPEKYCSEGSN